jgi:hypothetical protein
MGRRQMLSLELKMIRLPSGVRKMKDATVFGVLSCAIAKFEFVTCLH